MHKIGFVGCGNMARAMLSGVLRAGLCGPADVIVSARTQTTLDAVHAEFGVDVAGSNAAAAQAGMVVLAVKPQMYEQVIGEIASALSPETIVVSIAPGKTLAWLAEKTGAKKIVRLMPNTPAAIGRGMTSVAFGDGLGDDDKARIMAFVESFGEGEVLSEHLFDAATAVAGCSPAYVYMFIEAMADAAVAEGLPRASAYRMASAAVAGSARMVLQTGQHPGALKDAVCSPAGTTIEGVRVLEERGMRSAVIECLLATVEKARRL